jgi:group I intron endonuclease
MIKTDIGVYKITTANNNMFYIGSSSRSIIKRLQQHFCDLKKNKHHSLYLQRVYNKYGKSILKIEILEYCNKENILEREQYYIDTLNPVYNTCKIAGNSTGKKHSKETREKQSKKRLEYFKNNPPTRGKEHHHYGKKLSEEHKAKIKLAGKGRIFSEESKRKMSESRKQIKKNSPEVYLKLSKVNKEKKLWKVMHSPEAIEKATRKRFKKVFQYNKNNEFIAEFESLVEAFKITGVRKESISRTALKYNKHAGGFIWSYTKLH